MYEEFDEIDRRILNALQQDASQTNAELAQTVHVSPPTCLRRVKHLTESGVIERQVAIVSPEKVGARLTAIVEITLDVQAADRMAEFEARRAAMLPGVAGARFRADGAGGRHASLSRAGPSFVRHPDQCAQRKSLLLHIPEQVRDQNRGLNSFSNAIHCLVHNVFHMAPILPPGFPAFPTRFPRLFRRLAHKLIHNSKLSQVVKLVCTSFSTGKRRRCSE
jgi:DNA-binding Lrp family transcriptional regulator